MQGNPKGSGNTLLSVSSHSGLAGITGVSPGASACNSISLIHTGSGQELSGTARGAAQNMDAGGPMHIAMVNVCDASHSPGLWGINLGIL